MEKSQAQPGRFQFRYKPKGIISSCRFSTDLPTKNTPAVVMVMSNGYAMIISSQGATAWFQYLHATFYLRASVCVLGYVVPGAGDCVSR